MTFGACGSRLAAKRGEAAYLIAAGYTGRVDFEWDEAKAAYNLAKQGVSFQEAATVFGDLLSMMFDDPDHSHDEHRALLVGMSDELRVRIISFTEGNGSIRIISAPETSRSERETYEHG